MAGDCRDGSLEELLEKPLALRVIIGVVCILSATGSCIIILSYCCYKEHRTRARYILVHLSISNIGQVVSNFIGTVVNFDRTFKNSKNFSYDIRTDRRIEEQLCTTQAFFTVYFSVCGMLWTISLAVYLYLVILSMKQAYFTRYFVWLSYVVCYGLPLLVSVWLLMISRLGYAPYSTPGYCGLMTRRPFQEGVNCDSTRYIYVEFLGYDIWIILTIFLTLLFYMSALCYLKHQEQVFESENFWKTVQSIDYKFIAIPLTFALQRIWSLVLNLLFTYIGYSSVDPSIRKTILPMLILMGIGNCIQGLIDAILFVAFTPSIRNSLINMFFCRGKKVLSGPTRFFKESKNYYDNNLRNYSPRYSLVSSSPINITPSQVSATPEPSTSFQESPGSSYSIQNVHTGHYVSYN